MARRGIGVMLVLSLGLLTACHSGPPVVPTPSPMEYQFDQDQRDQAGSLVTVSSGDLEFLGISDDQFKSVLPPSRYVVDPQLGRVFPAGFAFDLDFLVLGSPAGPQGVSADVWRWNVSFDPYFSYRFPESVGHGGAWWGLGYARGPIAAPVILTWPSETASRGGDETNLAAMEDQPVMSALLIVDQPDPASLEGAHAVGLSIYQASWSARPFKVDTATALIRLVYWAAVGLAKQYPGWAPQPIPPVNPAPYTPPEDGCLPTAAPPPDSPTPDAPPDDFPSWAPSPVALCPAAATPGPTP